MNDKSRDRQLKNFAVKVMPARDAEFERQLYIEYSNNGFQFSGISLLHENAEKLVKALSDYLRDAASRRSTEDK
jgi:hypothetical protein